MFTATCSISKLLRTLVAIVGIALSAGASAQTALEASKEISATESASKLFSNEPMTVLPSLSGNPIETSEGGFIKVLRALYGSNCGARNPDVTANVNGFCNTMWFNGRCSYGVDHRVLGDRAPNCAKDFVAGYRCPDGQLHVTGTTAEASGKIVTFTCPPAPPAGKIKVLRALYGANCRAPYPDVTWYLAAACNGKDQCYYAVDHRILSDRAPNCAKDYVVDFNCGPGALTKRVNVTSEASGKTVNLSCR